MNEIISIIGLIALGICLILNLIKLGYKNDKVRRACNMGCNLMVFIAIALLIVNMLIGSDNSSSGSTTKYYKCDKGKCVSDTSGGKLYPNDPKCKGFCPGYIGKKCDDAVEDCMEPSTGTMLNCCNCSCEEGDVLDPFVNYCRGKKSSSSLCCGGKSGMTQWCAKKGTDLANQALAGTLKTCPKNKGKTFTDSKIQSSLYLQGVDKRCVDRCRGSVCDNKSPPQ